VTKLNTIVVTVDSQFPLSFRVITFVSLKKEPVNVSLFPAYCYWRDEIYVGSLLLLKIVRSSDV